MRRVRLYYYYMCPFFWHTEITSKDMKNELRIPTLYHGRPVAVRVYADRVGYYYWMEIS